MNATAVAYELRRLFKSRNFGAKSGRRWIASAQWRPRGAMLIVGMTGELLFTMTGGFACTAVLSEIATLLRGGDRIGPAAIAAAGCLVTFAGAVTASTLVGRFRLAAPEPWSSIRCLTGGTMMGFSGGMIPGGKDTMVLHSLPGLAQNALAAYAAMFAGLVLLTAVETHWRKH